MSRTVGRLTERLYPWKRLFLLLAIVLFAVIALVCAPRIPQDPDYHLFADSVERFGIRNGSNVLSNVIFVIAGVAGLQRVIKPAEFAGKFMWAAFYCSVTLVGFGSAYYHLQPSNASLVWDRLPMTLAFSSLTACLFAERIGLTMGRMLFAPLLASGVLSVAYWWVTEKAGVGDLRPYILVQYLPMVLLPTLIILFRKETARDRPYLILFAGYALAKVLEWQDAVVFVWTGYLVSGHTLKHIVAATAILLFRPELPDRLADRDKA